MPILLSFFVRRPTRLCSCPCAVTTTIHRSDSLADNYDVADCLSNHSSRGPQTLLSRTTLFQTLIVLGILAFVGSVCYITISTNQDLERICW
jgi:hypothetical protein